MHEKYNVAVLMSAYNGAKYIQEQVESIFAQKKVNVTLYVRDDGSSDKTVYMIEQLKLHYNIQTIKGENIGWRRSFMELLRVVPGTFQYYAFSDQDDIWLPEKLISSIRLLEKSHKPALCCSAQTLVDANLLRLKEEVHQFPKNYREAMTNISCRGCTEVFNNALLYKLQQYTPSVHFAHDRWASRVACMVGDIIFDSNSYILYRQHESNSAGNNYNVGIKDKISRALQNYKNKDFYYWYAKEILYGYGDELDKEKMEFLQLLIASRNSLSAKVKLFLSKDFVSESIEGTALLKLIMLFGIYQS